GPADFIETNIGGTFNILEIIRRITQDGSPFRLHHISTDEVFGSLGPEGYFTEESAYRPNSPYSASKASSDLLVRAYHKTYGLDVVTTYCSNNYGLYQFPEKLIPLIINNARTGKPLPVYGDGKQIRDWLYVIDHCEAIDLVFHKGVAGETYCIGGHNEMENIQIVRLICKLLTERLGCQPLDRLIQFVTDRPGHDRRYAIDASHIKNQLGWEPRFTFETGIQMTLDWYLENQAWLENCVSGEYRKYYETTYSNR
ncbi:MAG: GDP-mannose 4,6-dehydratase, partial [candidate division Zixibacteria bacterium]|nr:GDP-mannose 4,6-dehydratase [candidate division Zixibacteria bacterium]